MKLKISDCLKLIFEKKDHHLLFAGAMDVLSYGLGNFWHDPSLKIFDVNWRSF